MKRPKLWWTTVKGSRRAMRSPFKWRDSIPRSVKIDRIKGRSSR